jgi:site-specific DNA-cytosine methylase
MNRPTCLDLFCGCGGFTLGMQRAGFDVLAAVDFNGDAVVTLNAISKVRTACEVAGQQVSDHFADVGKTVDPVSGSQRQIDDIMLAVMFETSRKNG